MCACRYISHLVSLTSQILQPLKTRIVAINRVVFILLLLVLNQELQLASSLSVNDFIPFGAAAKDIETERKDDGGSGLIKLSVKFPFFGSRHDTIYVNNNGIISFVAELQTYTPSNFSELGKTPILAPYWADVDNSNNTGTVYFRETRDQSTVAKATKEIRAYSAYRNFQANWVFVATWYEVGFYGASAEGQTKKNTFQSALALDITRQQSFVILNYAKLEWTAGTNSGGDKNTGLGNSPAQAGFKAGDEVHYYELQGAKTPSVINLTQISNVGVPGKWIFRIDSAEIQDVCSQFNSGLVTFQPSYASMLGGSSISVDGLCFDDKIPPMKGRLDTSGGNAEELCCFVENVSVKCFLPHVFQTGLVNISLNIDNRGWNYSGNLEIKNIVDMPVDIKRIDPDNWVAGKSVSFSWVVDFFESAPNYQFEVLVYKTKDGRLSLETVFSKILPRNLLKTYAFDMPEIKSDASIAVVRAIPLPNNCSSNLPGPAIYSDIFPIQFANVTQPQSKCMKWLSEKPNSTPLSVSGHCPCTLGQAEGDTAQYSADPLCSVGSDWPSNCKYRSKLANHCIIPNHIEDGNFVCCYHKETGELLMALEGDGGGTMNRFNIYEVSQDGVPYFTYMNEEVSPYLHCCDFSNNKSLCDKFLNVRPPVDCRGYHPPAAAQAAGDPHMVTLDGLSYTFNGNGQFILLRVKDTDVTVQVQAVPAPSETNATHNATVFSAVALRASNTSSVLEIRLRHPDEQNLVSIYKDFKPFQLNTPVSQFTEMTLHWNMTSNHTAEATVVMDKLGLSVLVQATEDMLNIIVMAGVSLKGQLQGLLGNFNGNKTDDLTARNGTTLMPSASMRDIHYVFGMSWNISNNESLFTKPADDELSESNNNEAYNSTFAYESYSPTFIDEMTNTSFPNDTKEVCAENQECYFDYLVTGKKSIAMATRLFNERFEERLKDVKAVVRCPYVNTSAIENGSRNLTGLQVGASLTVSCDDGFEMSESKEVKCAENGEWDTSPPTCVRVKSGDSIHIAIAIGAASGGFFFIVVIAVVIKIVHRKCSNIKVNKSVGSEMEQGTDLPIIFTISDIPSPVFENNLFMSSLLKLREKGSFRIPRPTFVDPNIYKDFF